MGRLQSIDRDLYGDNRSRLQTIDEELGLQIKATEGTTISGPRTLAPTTSNRSQQKKKAILVSGGPAETPLEDRNETIRALRSDEKKPIDVIYGALPPAAKSFFDNLSEGLFGNVKQKATIREFEKKGVNVPLIAKISTEGALPFLGRTKTEEIEYISDELEKKGIGSDRAAEIAFAEVFSRGGWLPEVTKEGIRKPVSMKAQEMLKKLKPTDEELSTLRWSRLGFAVGSGLDVLNVTPVAGITKKVGGISLTKAIKNVKNEPEAIRILTEAGASDDLAKMFAESAVNAKTEKEAGKIIQRIEQIEKGTTKKVIENNPLLLEARKYKSAEKFVEAQGQSVFRGGDETIDTTRGGGKGISVSDKETAGLFTPPGSGVVDEAVLPNTAKILKEGDIPINLQDAYIGKAKILADPNNFSPALQRSVIEKQQAIIEYARKNGFDAVEFPFEKEIRIVKPNILKTKSQLTDIWEKAQTLKTRGLLESARESEQFSDPLKATIEARIPESNKVYGVITDRDALIRANELIDENGMDTAVNLVLTSKEPSKEVAVTAQELIRRYSQQGNHEMATSIFENLMEKSTRAGQFVQALSFIDKLSPEGVLHYAAKRMGRKPDEVLGKKILEQSKKIRDTKDGYYKILEQQKLAKMIANNVPRTGTEVVKDTLLELASLPRALMATGDLSFGLRQGLVAGWGYPKEFMKAFKSQFTAFRSEAGYNRIMDEVVTHPDFELAQNFGLSFTDVNAVSLSAKEEQFMSNLADKLIPWLSRGKGPNVIRASNRAYVAMGNKLRMDVFSSIVRNAEKSGIDIRKDAAQLRDITKIINDMTGRGELPEAFGIRKAAPVLNAVFFSPRLMASRLNLLNPMTYVKLTPVARKEALRSMISATAGTTTLLGLASLIPGVEIQTDPRSADFAKIKVGNTRFDIAGGFQQYMRATAQLISGKYISTMTGRVITLGEGYKPITRWDIFTRFFESKESPIVSFVTTIMRGQTFEGKEIGPKEVGQEVLNRMYPMLLNDLFEIAQDDPELLPLGIFGTFGIGLQYYKQSEAIETMKAINASPDPDAAFEKLSEENPALAAKALKAKREQSFTEFDWALTEMGVENGERAKFLFEKFQSLPDDDARDELWDELEEKRILSKQVADQLHLMYEK